MTIFVKALLGLVSIVGSCFTISAPLLMDSNKQLSINSSFSEDSEGKESIQQASLEYGSKVERVGDNKVVHPNLSFENSWKKINADYQKENHLNSGADLPWKEEFKKIINADTATNRNGTLKSSFWRGCKDKNYLDLGFCGYLHLEDSQKEYKLKVVYEGGAGKVTVVKKDGSTISYYRNSANQGIPKESIVVPFENLTVGNNSKNVLGEEMSEPSIVKN